MNINPAIPTDSIPVEISVRIGMLRMTVAELSALKEGDVLPLDQAVEDGVEICVGDHVLAKGELITDDADDSRLMLRITQAAGAGTE
ncbi:FliM/FliN family flagellar motor switch protein [Paracoccus aerodenitrificans]|uniref:FliM/FliN family flagellar motor switch protein n=1 Tax=Paracoccus aerodenitrificans TaxID=3017781 RepID=UPI0022F08892|nr:FliM/FliN family flagellar motor switch protein [Paracoccus aerodenitrificans]WBU63951.1 FliM/FliN family flagellar motor switch protein [Paracoccus aerodenitrificans]